MPMHEVDTGEWIGAIVARYGHRSWREVWNHPRNEQLRQQRPDPNLLAPGDRLFVPDPAPADIAAPTDRAHVFCLAPPSDKLCLCFADADDIVRELGPLAFTLRAGTNSISGELTSSDQVIEIDLPIDVDTALLDLGGTMIQLPVGTLDPVESVSGMQARLNNLGIDAGPADNHAGSRTARATRAFQVQCGLEPDGVISSETCARMKEVYGF